MTQPISFFVPGIPKAQPRPRAFARKILGKWTARVYEAGSAEEWKSAIALAARAHLPKPLAGAEITITFWMPRPKSHFGKNGLKQNARSWPTTKPDLDNLVKAVIDTLTKLGFWRDDSCVCAVHAIKLYATPLQAGASISIDGKINPA